jgi:ADP-heptose:LPS heptosyltransferase
MLGILRRLVDALAARLTSAALAVAVGEPLFWLFGFRRAGPPRTEEVRSILVVRLDHIGDTVLTTPLLRELRHGVPRAEITLVVPPVAKELFEACPHVDEVLSYDPRMTGQFPLVRRHWRALVLAARYLWRKRIELALMPRFSRDRYHALFVSYFSGAAQRVAYEQSRNDAGARADFHHLTTRGLAGREGTRHEVLRNMEFLERLGLEPVDRGLELWTREEDLDRLTEEFTFRGIPLEPFVAVAPGAGERRKMWPVENYCALVPLLVNRLGVPILVVGDSTEWPLGEQVSAVDRNRVFNVCGALTLRSLAVLLDRCDLFVGNDSGPKHIAAARGVPIVEISLHPENGPANHAKSPERFGPWGVSHRVCRPQVPVPPCKETCAALEAHCIRSVSVADVMSAVDSLVVEEDLVSSSMLIDPVRGGGSAA